MDKVKQVIKDSLNLNYNPSEYSQDTIPEWDSLGHLSVVMELEQEFGIKFNSSAIPKLTSLESIKCQMMICVSTKT